MIKTVGQPSDDRWMEAFRDDFGMIHANKAKEFTDTPAVPPIKTSPSNIYTTSKRTLPSQQAWRSEKVFGRIVNFFEQSVFLLKKVWPTRPPKVDQRLMASLHGQRVAALDPTGSPKFLGKSGEGASLPGEASLSRVLKYTISFLESQKGEDKPPKKVIKTLQQTAKWASTLDNAKTLTKFSKRQNRLVGLSKSISKAIVKLREGESCMIPGGWKDAEGFHEAFYQVTKNPSGNYDVKILSRDPTVKPQSVIYVAGTTKFYPETTFKEIKREEIANAKWLQALLSLQMPSGGVEGNFLTRLVETPTPHEVIPSSNLLKQVFIPFIDRLDLQPKSLEKYRQVSSTGIQMKNLWMVVDILHLETKNKMLPSERRKLQLKVNSLFQFYQAVRKDLSHNQTNQILLEEGILNVGKLASLMHAQGKLTEAEVAVINRELLVIKQEILKANRPKLLKNKKDVFLLKRKLPSFSFKTEKFKTKPVNEKWIEPISQPEKVIHTKVDPLPQVIAESKIRPAKVAPLPPLTTENIHSVLQDVRKTCRDLATKGEDALIQQLVDDLIFNIQLPDGELKTIKGSKQETFEWHEKNIKWSTLKEKELEECGIALSEISGFLSDVIKKNGTASRENIALQIKSGFLQEYLARLNPSLGVTSEHRFTFWQQANDFFGNNRRKYSPKEFALIPELSEYETIASGPKWRHKNFVQEIKVYNTSTRKYEKIYHRYIQRPVSGIKKAPQLVAMEAAMEKFQNFYSAKFFDAKESTKIENLNWDKKFEYSFWKFASTRRFLLGNEDDFSEQYARDMGHRVANLPDPNNENIAKEISKEDMADLLVTLGDNFVVGMMGVIRQKPYLLSHSSVRTFFEYKLFIKSLIEKQFAQKTIDDESVPVAYQFGNWLKEQTQLFMYQGKIHETLFLMNLSLSVKHLLPVLPKFAAYLDFPDYREDIRNWAYASLNPQEEQYQYRHTIWKNFLLHHENLEELNGDQIADILKGISILATAPIEMYEEDPLINVRINAIKQKWKKPIQDFLSDPKNSQLTEHVLKSICQISNLPIPDQKWEGSFPIYRAEPFEIDLMEGAVKNINGDWSSRNVPADVQNNLNKDFSRKEFQNHAVNFSIKNKKETYRYTDQKGYQTLVVKISPNESRGYKELEVPDKNGKNSKIWFESIDKNQLLSNESNTRTFIVMRDLIKNLLQRGNDLQSKNAEISKLLDQPDFTYWINPKNSAQVVVLDTTGTPKYQVLFKKKGNRLVIVGLMDLQEHADVKKFKTVGYLTDKIAPIWKQLTALDDPKNISVWKAGNRIEKVVLDRYNLAFAEREGKVVCTDPRLNGWILENNALALDKGFKESIILRHPTIPSQYRILVPSLKLTEAKMITFSAKFVLKIIKSALQGRLLSFESNDPVADWALTFPEGNQNFWIFDINPATAEFEEVGHDSVKPYLHLAKLSFIHNRPETSLEMLMQMRRVKKWSESDVEEISDFLQFLSKFSKSPDATALELHCILLAKRLGPQTSRTAFESQIPQAYEDFAQVRNTITQAIRLDQKDEEACLDILADLDPTWSMFHTPLLPQKLGEKRKMEVYQREEPYHTTPEIRSHIDQFAQELLYSLAEKPKKSTLEFLSRNPSRLATDFVRIYKLATQRDIKHKQFQELDLTLCTTMPAEGIGEDYLKTLQNFLTRVLDIRKAGKDVPFPVFPTMALSEHEEAKDEVTLKEFLIKLETAVKAAEKGQIPVAEEEHPVENFDFEEALLQQQIQKATNHLKADGTIEEMSLTQLKQALGTKTPHKKSFALIEMEQSLYTPSELSQFFGASKNHPDIPQLDLSDLQRSENKVLQKTSNKLAESIHLAKEATESVPQMEFIDGEKSRIALEKDLFKKKKEWEDKQKKAHEAVLELIQEKSTPAYELQHKAKLIKNVDLDLLLKHFLQSDLEALKPDLPDDISFEELKVKLGNYLLFATEAQRFDGALEEIKSFDSQVSPITISEFYQQLIAKRQYDPQKDSHLLIFEYMTNLLLRKTQLKMIQDFLQDPDCVRQASTGVGKTTVILVLLALMQADGTNLVSVNFPKHLLEENLHDLSNKLGKIYQRSVYALKFDMNTPLKLPTGESLFKQMYEDLMRTSLQKGVVVTALESQQALEQKWIALMDQQSKMSPDKITPLEKQHLKFLTKILMLKQEREYTILDEFDKALNQREERHVKVGKPVPIPKRLWGTTLDLYELLLAVPELDLLRNTQGDTLSDAQRNHILDKVADQVAAKWGIAKGLSASEIKEVKSYIKGENEDILAKIQHWSPEEKDTLSLQKDEFYTFLPLTLSKTCQVRYMRSDDNVHTVPCLASDIPRNHSEFDQLLEKLNYTIQDYYQTGIREPVIQQWIATKKRLAETAVMNGAYKTLDETPEAQIFAQHFPGYKLGSILSSQISGLVEELNQDPKRIRRFLEEVLAKLEVSSGKISCDANDFVSMQAHTAGASATLGSVHALPPSLHTEDAEDKGATGKMVISLLQKCRNPDGSLSPLKRFKAGSPATIIPEAMKQDADIQIVIDGSGVAALHGLSPGLPAKQLLQNQPSKTKVEGIIFGGKGKRQEVETKRGAVSLDASGLKPAKLGGFFSEIEARGADYKMMPGGRAYVTAKSRQLLEELIQTVGRLRRPDQRVVFGVPEEDPLKNVEDLVKTSLKNSVERDADDTYRGTKKDFHNKLRSAMIKSLFDTAKSSNMQGMLARYREFVGENILISETKNNYTVPGSYFAAHAHISRQDKDPQIELNQLKGDYTNIARKLGLAAAVEAFEKHTYSDEFLMHLPKKVFSVGSPSLEQEVEIEVETEIEKETEIEVEVEAEVEKKPRRYDQWIDIIEPSNNKDVSDIEYFHLLQTILPGASKQLGFTENFFPLSQNKKKNPQSSLVRQPHDDIQNPAHYVLVYIDEEIQDAKSMVLMDTLEFSRRTLEKLNHRNGKPYHVYDLRLKRFIEGALSQPGVVLPDPATKPEFNHFIAQIRFFNGEYDTYSKEEMKALRNWLGQLKKTSPQLNMEKHFKKVILKNKREALKSYPFSPLAKVFKTGLVG